MPRSVLTAALVSVALAGLLLTVSGPSPLQAASPQSIAGPTMVGQRPVHYHDLFSGSGPHRTDTDLGFTTHWEGLINLSDPTSPIEWTRAKNVTASLSANSITVGGAQPFSQLQSRTRRQRTATLTRGDCSGGAYGIRLWYDENENGADGCLRLTGVGSQNLAGVGFPYKSTYADSSKSMSTAGSSAHGHLSCAGGDWSYTSGGDWNSLLGSSGSKNCDGFHAGVYAVYSD